MLGIAFMLKCQQQLLLVNDVPSHASFNVVLFADETELWWQKNNRIFTEMSQFRCALLGTSNKYRYMAIAENIKCKNHYSMMKTTVSVSLSQNEIEKVLCVIFSSEFEFNRHINKQCTKANQVYDMLINVNISTFRSTHFHNPKRSEFLLSRI